MSDIYPPETPPRRFARRSHLTPSKHPYVTPSKTPSTHSRAAIGVARCSPARGSLVWSRQNSSSHLSATPQYTPSSRTDGDRYIPSRRRTNIDLCRQALLSGDKRPRNEGSPNAKLSQETPLQKEFKRRMLSSLCNVPLECLDENAKPRGILGITNAQGEPNHSKAPYSPDPYLFDTLRAMKLGGVEMDPAAHLSVASKVVRKVPSAPVRILDAPDIVDDYYLNLVSWSLDNILAVALARSVYLWNASTGDIHHLLTVDEGSDYITSVCWCTMPGQTHCIAVGTNASVVHLYDGRVLRKIRTLTGHTSRVASLAWSHQWLSSGGRDSLILNHDMRTGPHVVAKYRGHTQEICGLKWNDEGSCLASGGNENYLCLWDATMSSQRSNSQSHSPVVPSLSDHNPRVILKQHKAAVKALGWCPFHRGLLASGGGTADRTIKFWNSASGAMLNSVDTGSQVCSIVWSKHQRELCSSHGYSENQLILWKYPAMTKIKELTGHTARVLNMDLSPDGTSVVSAGADETLRFWNVFETQPLRSNGDVSLVGDLSFGGHLIR